MRNKKTLAVRTRAAAPAGGDTVPVRQPLSVDRSS